MRRNTEPSRDTSEQETTSEDDRIGGAPEEECTGTNKAHWLDIRHNIKLTKRERIGRLSAVTQQGQEIRLY